jgi:hypothetical protein
MRVYVADGRAENLPTCSYNCAVAELKNYLRGDAGAAWDCPCNAWWVRPVGRANKFC